LQSADPGTHVGGDAGGQVNEFVLEPGLEGGDAVVVEESTAGEDLGDASDADPILRRLKVAGLISRVT
jgi:hypothetical protein